MLPPTATPTATPTVAPVTTPTVPPTPTVAPTPLPALEELELYADGAFRNGYASISWNEPPPDPNFTGRTLNGSATLWKDLYVEGDSGEFMSVFSNGLIEVEQFTHVRFMANSTSGPGSWISVSLAAQPWAPAETSAQVYVPPGQWTTFTVSIDSLLSLSSTDGYRGIGFQGEPSEVSASTNSVAFGKISLVRLPDVEPPQPVGVQDINSRRVRIDFNEVVAFADTSSFTVSSTGDTEFTIGRNPASISPLEGGRSYEFVLDRDLKPFTTYSIALSNISDSAGQTLNGTTIELDIEVKSAVITVNAARDVHEFSDNMRGVAMNNWNWIWGGIEQPGSPKREALITATKELKPGVIRFAGGLWVNNTGWDRHGVAPVDGIWGTIHPDTGDEVRYTHAYKPEMIDSYADFARQVGAETIMQVNICDNNPAMWVDLLRYTNIEHDYNFRYWELGNEIDLAGCINEFEYAERFVTYSEALRAVDPGIRILGPVPSMPARTRWIDALEHQPGAKNDVLTFHWYQLTEWTTNEGAFAYQGGSLDALLSYNTSVGTGCQDGFGCPGEVINPSRIDRMTYRRGIPETVANRLFADFLADNPDGETAITELGVHASLHEHPINGNHLAAIWLADILGRWAYNGLDILTYYSLEDGNNGVGNTRGLLGIDNPEFLDVRPTYYTEWLYASHFGDMMVESGTSDPAQEIVGWASRDTNDPDVLKLILINLGAERADATVRLSGFVPASGSAYLMSSRTPTSLANPESFSEHQTSINGVQIPDVAVGSPQNFLSAIDSISPAPVSMGSGNEFTYEMPPYSVVAVTLTR